ncbi:transposase InsO family protein [Arthrobacter sp. UYCu723]
MAVEKFGASERFACKVIGQNRSGFRKKKPDMGFEEAELRTQLCAVANVIDEYTRTALAVVPRRSFKASDVVAVMENIIAETGAAPAYVRCDNGPEFTPAALIDWCDTAGVDTAFIDPGSPWQNGFIESFNAQFRREQLSGEIIDTMAEAKYLAEEWKAIYNHERPHGSLNGMTPKRYWDNWTERTN